MKRAGLRVLLAAVLLLGPTTRADGPHPAVGTVEHLQIMGLDRLRATCWARAVLPRAAEGSFQKFNGTMSIANVPIPLKMPLRVAVQKRPDRIEAVFDFVLPLKDMPPGLLTAIGSHALDLTFDGTLTGEKGSEARTYAVGVLRYGTAESDVAYDHIRQFMGVGGARLTGVTLRETTGQARLCFDNPFAYAIPVREVSYALISADQKICSGKREAFRIHPGRENAIDLELTADNR